MSTSRQALRGKKGAESIEWVRMPYILLVMVALTPILFLGLFSYRLAAQTIELLRAEDNLTAASMAVELVQHDLKSSLSLVKAIAAQPGLVEAVEKRKAESVRLRLRRIVEEYSQIDRAFVADLNGSLWVDYPYAPESQGKSFAFRDWYSRLKRTGKACVSDVYLRHAQPKVLIVSVASYVRDLAGKPIAILLYQYRLDELTNWLDGVQVGSHGYAFVLDGKGTVAGHPKIDLADKVHKEYAALPFVQEALQGKLQYAEYIDPMMKETVMAVFQPLFIGDRYWVVVAQQLKSVAFAPIRQLAVQVSLAALVLCGLGVAFSLYVSRISRRNEELIKGLSQKSQELELANQKLVVATEEAQQAANVKSTFLANMSHEIRTPLNGLVGMAELLMQTPLNEEQQEMVGTMINSSDLLLSLVNDILDLSRLEAGKLVVKCHEFHLLRLLEDTVRLLKKGAQEKGLTIMTFVSPELPLTLCGDAIRLRQILLNLLSNAIKFTEQGEVIVKVLPNSDNLDSKQVKEVDVKFVVSDTGIGLSPETQEALFQPFMQADASMTRKYGGSGLGLSITKHLVELMGGKINVQSTQGIGSTFWFTVCLATETTLVCSD